MMAFRVPVRQANVELHTIREKPHPVALENPLDLGAPKYTEAFAKTFEPSDKECLVGDFVGVAPPTRRRAVNVLELTRSAPGRC